MFAFQEKPFWRSKTVWGVALTVLGGIMAQSGVRVPWTDADIPAMAGEIVGLIGAGLAVYGRFRAKTAVRLK